MYMKYSFTVKYSSCVHVSLEIPSHTQYSEIKQHVITCRWTKCICTLITMHLCSIDTIYFVAHYISCGWNILLYGMKPLHTLQTVSNCFIWTFNYMEWFFFSYNELYCTVYSVGWNIILTLQWNIAKNEILWKQ